MSYANFDSCPNFLFNNLWALPMISKLSPKNWQNIFKKDTFMKVSRSFGRTWDEKPTTKCFREKNHIFSEDIILIHVKKVILAVKSRLCYYYSAKYCPPINLRWTLYQFKLLDGHRKRLMMLKSWSCTLGSTFIKQGTFSIILLET